MYNETRFLKKFQLLYKKYIRYSVCKPLNYNFLHLFEINSYIRYA